MPPKKNWKKICVHTSNLAAKTDFIDLKSNVINKPDINKLVNVPTGLNTLKLM